MSASARTPTVKEQLTEEVRKISTNDPRKDINKYTSLLVQYIQAIPPEAVVAQTPDILVRFVMPVIGSLTDDERGGIGKELKYITNLSKPKRGGRRKTRRRRTTRRHH
jgi:hypothetical protein